MYTSHSCFGLYFRQCEIFGVEEALCVLTSDPYEIIVMAPNASKLKNSFDLMSKGCEFNIITENGGPLFTKHRKGKKISADLKVVVERLVDNEYQPEKQTACELILIGRNRSVIEPDPQGSLYVVVPAHLVLTDEECKDIASGKSNIQKVRDSVGARSSHTRLYLESSDTAERFDLSRQPLLCYRHYYDGTKRSSASDEFMTDFALLEISTKGAAKLMNSLSKSMRQEGNIKHRHPQMSTLIERMMTRQQEYHFLESYWITIPIDKIFPQVSISELGDMFNCEVRIVCKGILGYMYRVAFPIGRKKRYAHHITFICEDKG